MITFPNCKINLGLFVTGKRSDGYHNIESIFLPVPWKEALELVPSPDGQTHVHITGAGSDVDPKNNTVYKAWSKMHERFGIAPVHFYLNKTLPSGAGIGGGSADGAFALKLLNHHFELGASQDELKRIASEIGSDCPFFITNQPAFVSGRGEVMEDFPMDLKGIYAVLIHPGVHMSTAEAYRLLQPQPASFDLKGLNNLPRQTWKDYVKNDFESAIASVHPIIAEIKDLFYQKGAFYASMSGSGSTVYGLFEGEVSFQSQWPNASIWQGYLID